MNYKLKPSKTVVIITILGTLVGFYLLYATYDTSPKWIFWVFGIPGALLIFYYALSMPISVTVSQELICVKKIIGSKCFTRADYEISSIKRKDMKGAVRLFGSGGIGGYIGTFSNSKFGKFYMLASCQKNMYLLKNIHSNKQYVINLPKDWENA